MKQDGVYNLYQETFLIEVIMPRLKEEQRLELIEKYKTGKFTCRGLARIYGVDKGAIAGLLRRRGVVVNNDPSETRRVYPLNQKYFEKIDTERKAYFLGFLYADGCNLPSKNSIILSLIEADKDILNEFKKDLETTKPLSYKNIKKYNNARQDMYALHITSKTICQNLINLGCVPKKSLILKFPTEDQVPSHLIRHFIRGYFDGDGGICLSLIKGRKTSNISIVSTLDFCLSCKEIIKNETGINIGIVAAGHTLKRGNNITKCASFGGNIQVKTFLNWIYKDATIYLQRKYDKYQRILSWYDSNGKIIREKPL